MPGAHDAAQASLWGSAVEFEEIRGTLWPPQACYSKSNVTLTNELLFLSSVNV